MQKEIIQQKLDYLKTIFRFDEPKLLNTIEQFQKIYKVIGKSQQQLSCNFYESEQMSGERLIKSLRKQQQIQKVLYDEIKGEMRNIGLEYIYHPLDYLFQQIFFNQKMLVDYMIKNYDMMCYQKSLKYNSAVNSFNIKLSSPDSLTPEDQFRGYEAEKKMSDYLQEALGMSRTEVEQMLQKRKDLLSVGKSKANIFLSDLLSSYGDVIKRQNRILNKTELYLSNIDHREQIYDILLDSIKNNMSNNMQKSQEKLNQTVTDILTRHNLKQEQLVHKEVQCLIPIGIDSKLKAKESFQELYTQSKMQFLQQEITQQIESKYAGRMDELREKEEKAEKRAKQLEATLQSTTTRADNLQTELKNVTQNMKNLMKEQVRSLLAQDEQSALLDNLQQENEEMKETISKLKAQLKENKEVYYSHVNEKGKDKYKIQVLEKKVMEQGRDLEEQGIHNDHLKKSIEALSLDIEKREFREQELREIMVGKISEIRRLQSQVDQMEITQQENQRQIEILLNAKSKGVEQRDSPEKEEVKKDETPKRESKFIKGVKAVQKSTSMIKAAASQVKNNPPPTSSARKSIAPPLLSKQAQKVITQNNTRRSVANKLISNAKTNKFKREQTIKTEQAKTLHRNQENNKEVITVQRISESSEEESRRPSKNISHRTNISKNTSNLSSCSSTIRVQVQRNNNKSQQNKNKVNKPERAKTPAEIKRQIEENMSKYMKPNEPRTSVSQGHSKRTQRINVMPELPSGSKSTRSRGNASKLSGEFQFTEQMGINSLSSTPKVYPFKNVKTLIETLKDKEEKIMRVELQDQAHLKNQIMCQFIKNHRICGNECQHQTDFYQQFGMLDNKSFSPKQQYVDNKHLSELVEY